MLQQLAGIAEVEAMTACVQKASGLSRERLQNLLRARDVRSHGQFKRLFGGSPPNKVLCLWAEALEVNPHPDVTMAAYAAPEDFVSDVRRIAAWFSKPRRLGKAVGGRKPLEDAADASSRTSGALLVGANVKAFLDMVQEPLLSSLLSCGDAHRRFTALGLRVPTGTTIVEQGFGATSMVMFEKPTRWVSPSTFRRHAMLTVLLLNFSILRGCEMDYLNCRDKRVLALLETAFQRLHASAGLSLSRSASKAESLFRACVGSLETAEDASPADARELEVVLPWAEDDGDSSGSE